MEIDKNPSKTMTIRYPVKIDDDIQFIMAKSVEQHGCTVSRNCIVNTALKIGLPVIAETFDTQSTEGSKND